MSAKSVRGILIAGGFAVVSLAGCAYDSGTRSANASEIGSINELQQEWDELEAREGAPKDGFRKQYAKSLQTLNNAISEIEQYEELVRWSREK